jgi:hypothetical protein
MIMIAIVIQLQQVVVNFETFGPPAQQKQTD